MTQVAFQLPDDLGQFLQSTVRSGGFHDASEFFTNIVANLKEQAEAPLTREEELKLASLRADIQHAVDQAERGEVVHDFSMEAFLEERHREHATTAA